MAVGSRTAMAVPEQELKLNSLKGHTDNEKE